MKRYVKWLTLGVLAGACILLAAQVTTDFDHSADFSRYKTYSWLKVDAGNPLWPDRIRRAVDAELMAKGWTPVPSGGDAAVSAFGSTHVRPRLQTFYDDFGGGWYWRGFGTGTATTTVDYIPIGTLVVDIFDGNTKRLIWRGVGSDALSEKPEKNEKKLEKTVEDMFKHFPPKPKD